VISLSFLTTWGQQLQCVQTVTSATLVLMIIEIERYDISVGSNSITSIPNFIRIHPAVRELDRGQTDTW
jgi:hypothetical protein